MDKMELFRQQIAYYTKQANENIIIAICKAFWRDQELWFLSLMGPLWIVLFVPFLWAGVFQYSIILDVTSSIWLFAFSIIFMLFFAYKSAKRRKQLSRFSLNSYIREMNAISAINAGQSHG